MDPDWVPCDRCSCVDGDAGFQKWELRGILKTRICPRRLISDASRQWVELYPHYASGFLLYAGGIFDQPAIYMQVMKVIHATVNSNDESR